MKYEIENVTVEFPYEAYPVQLEYMKNVILGMENKGHCLLEAPTGVGKTMSLLCASLAWQIQYKQKKLQYWYDLYNEKIKLVGKQTLKERKQMVEIFDAIESSRIEEVMLKIPTPKIYYSTRTHSQIAQVVRELKKTVYRPEMVVLGSRNQYCINKSLEKSVAKNDDCNRLVHENKCMEFRNVDLLVSAEKFKPKGSNAIWDIEDLVKEGKEIRSCPYYASQKMLATAEIIFCPYNYIIDPCIRSSTNIVLEGNVFIFDESHNIEDISRSATSFSAKWHEFDSVQKDFDRLLEKGSPFSSELMELKKIFLKVMEWMHGQILSEYRSELYANVYTDTQIVDVLLKFSLTKDKYVLASKTFLDLCDRLLEVHPEDDLTSKTKILIEHFLTIIGFVFMENSKFLPDYRVVLTRVNNVLEFNFWCMNPRVGFDALKEDTHNIILTSGTLSPMDSFASELDIEFKYKFEGTHVIDMKKQVLVHTVNEGPRGVKLNLSYKDSGSIDLQTSLGELIVKYCQLIGNGVLLFFPSYSLMDKLLSVWATKGILDQIKKYKSVFVEPRKTEKAEDFTNLLIEYNSEIERTSSEPRTDDDVTGAIFFAVCRGKVSEGLDFSDNKARCVILVGIPYPNLTDLQVDLKKKFNDEGSKSSKVILPGSRWYTLQAFRAVNQAIGRCIRHRNDCTIFMSHILVGCIILVDERYQNQTTLSGISKWLRSVVQNLKFQPSANLIKIFFQRLKNAVSLVSITSPQGKAIESVKEEAIPSDQLEKTHNIEITFESKEKDLLICGYCHVNVGEFGELVSIGEKFPLLHKICSLDSKFHGFIHNAKNCGSAVTTIPKIAPAEMSNDSCGENWSSLTMKFFTRSHKGEYYSQWNEEDNIIYNLIFCSSCSSLLGFKVHAVSTITLNFLEQVFMHGVESKSNDSGNPVLPSKKTKRDHVKIEID